MSASRLLILDDDPEIGETIAGIAETVGVAVRWTTDPGEFFELSRVWTPTHIALDLVMPAMDGVEVLGRLARRQCTASLILISGVSERVLQAARRSAKEQGLLVAGVLTKPFSKEVLRDLISGKSGAAPSSPGEDEEVAPTSAKVITVSALQNALKNHELLVYYMPKIQCGTGHVAGYEALVRWMHPEYGIVMPDSFIPFAEANHMMGELTAEVLDQALRWFSEQKTRTAADGAPHPHPHLAINISAQNLSDEYFVENVLATCKKYGVEPQEVIFELTESCAMENPVLSLALLTRLRMKGFHLAIDDFGTGFSSMLQLVRLPFSEIKIDKSFVMKGTATQESRSVVKSIVDLAKSLGLTSTAEGVDDGGTLAYLGEIGCDLAQGYFIGRPSPAGAVSLPS
jgi:EAL domain-containing protein (putative c-di-GMP-specific phosphodiesterase class I)/FixJ family two-component response regulator